MSPLGLSSLAGCQIPWCTYRGLVKGGVRHEGWRGAQEPSLLGKGDVQTVN